jgi:hypothetical protein
MSKYEDTETRINTEPTDSLSRRLPRYLEPGSDRRRLRLLGRRAHAPERTRGLLLALT